MKMKYHSGQADPCTHEKSVLWTIFFFYQHRDGGAEEKSGELCRGSMVECEDNWNCQLENHLHC